MRRQRSPVYFLSICVVLLAAAAAHAQVDAPTPIDDVDPDAHSTSAVENGAPPDDEGPRHHDPLLDLPAPNKKKGTQPATSASPATSKQGVDAATGATATSAKKGEPAKDAGKDAAKEPEKTAPSATAPVAKAPLQPIAIPSLTDEDLAKRWVEWRAASESSTRANVDTTWKALLAARDELGITNLDVFAASAARSAQKRSEGNDPVGAIELAQAAVELAPDLPMAHFALARTYFSSEPTDVGRWGRELKATAGAFWRDPRYLRPALGDLGAALIAALLATALAVLSILFLRRARYFFHDFHHLFPRAAAKWQTVPLAIVLLMLPLVFRLGFIPVLLTLFLAATFYLEWKERILAAALIALVGLLPLAGGFVASATAFSGTVGEDLQSLERGGPDAAWAAKRVRDRMTQGHAGYAEYFALGRYEMRRGRLESATELFKKAAVENGNDARLQVDLANARLGLGDVETATTLYARAGEMDANLAASFFNTARLHYRKAQTLYDANEAAELEKAQSAQMVALQLDPSLQQYVDIAKDKPQPFNKLLVSPGLTPEEIRANAVLPDADDRVAAQLEWRLMGMAPGALASGLPFVAALLVLGFGALGRVVHASRACDKCGRAVCKRCDPEIGGGGLCGQCVNVFARKGLVAPQVKVRKQYEVDRYQTRTEWLSWIFGIACSGGGHVYAGATLRGALYAFSFLFLVFLAVFREGVLRAPFGDLPMMLRLVPALVVLAVVYILSLRSLRKAQAG